MWNSQSPIASSVSYIALQRKASCSWRPGRKSLRRWKPYRPSGETGFLTAFLFPFILGFCCRHGLPLHVRRGIRPAVFEGNDVVYDVAGASSMSVTVRGAWVRTHEGVTRGPAALDAMAVMVGAVPVVRMGGVVMGPTLGRCRKRRSNKCSGDDESGEDGPEHEGSAGGQV